MATRALLLLSPKTSLSVRNERREKISTLFVFVIIRRARLANFLGVADKKKTRGARQTYRTKRTVNYKLDKLSSPTVVKM